MDKFASLFRVFDLGFFAPGAVLFFSLQGQVESDLLKVEGSLTTAEGLAAIARMIAVIFLLGLSCHSIQRVLYTIWCPSSWNAPAAVRRDAWYFKLERERRGDLASYFWYMRATSWNLSLAVPIALIVEGVNNGWQLILLAPVVFCLLVFLGQDFSRASKDVLAEDESDTTPKHSTHNLTLKIAPPGTEFVVRSSDQRAGADEATAPRS